MTEATQLGAYSCNNCYENKIRSLFRKNNYDNHQFEL
jgi:hypothetical protein